MVIESKQQELLKKLDKTDRINFMYKIRKHYEAACRHLIEKTSVSNNLLKSLSVLSPTEKSSPTNERKIVKVAQAMPFNISETDLINEYILYHADNQSLSTKEHIRVDTYWGQIFETKQEITGNKKYPTLEKVVKTALILSHGNAQVERGFSQSGHIMTDERSSTSERTLNSIMTVKSCLTYIYHNQIEKVIITKDLMMLARTAFSRYKTYCEEQRQLKEKQKEIEKQNEIAEEEKRQLKRKLEEESKNITEEEIIIKKIKEEEKLKRDTVKRWV